MTRLLVAALTLLGCTETHTIMELDGEVPRGVDGGPPRPPDSGRLPSGRCIRGAPVDLLLVVDNSNSMTEEQASLATDLPFLMRALASGDLDEDGVRDFIPVEDLQVGVISTDMGTGGYRVPTCNEPNFGDDGILRTQGNTTIAGCVASYPPFLSFRSRDGTSPDAFAQDVTCVARMGTGGCGFEQQLEAMLKALTPSTARITPGFVMGSVGHGDRENLGFLRPDSLLSVLFLTDEEDCSAVDPSVFDPMSPTYTGDLNLRCFMYPTAVHPVSRYVDGLRDLRARRPDLLSLAFIVGIPPDLSAAGAIGQYDAILADDRMQERIDTTSPTPRLAPSCNVPGRGVAFPPRRLVELARSYPEQSVVQSICTASFADSLRNIVRVIGRRACAEYE